MMFEIILLSRMNAGSLLLTDLLINFRAFRSARLEKRMLVCVSRFWYCMLLLLMGNLIR